MAEQALLDPSLHPSTSGALSSRLAFYVNNGMFSEVLELLVKQHDVLEAGGLEAIVQAIAAIQTCDEADDAEGRLTTLMAEFATTMEARTALLALGVIFLKIAQQAAVTGPCFSPTKPSDKRAEENVYVGRDRFNYGTYIRPNAGDMLESLFPALAHPDKSLGDVDTHFARSLEVAMFVDGEPVYSKVPGISWFWVSRIVFSWLSNHTNPPPTLAIWRARGSYLHQRFLESGSTSLSASLVQLYVVEFAGILKELRLLPESFDCFHGDSTFAASFGHMQCCVRDGPSLVLHELPARIRPLLLAELALHLSYCGNVSAFREVIRIAADCIGLVVELTGAMGVRRQFQTTAVPQLVVKTKGLDQKPAGFGAIQSVTDTEMVKLEKMAQDGNLPEDRPLCDCGRPECPDTQAQAESCHDCEGCQDEPSQPKRFWMNNGLQGDSAITLEKIDAGTDLYERPKLTDEDDSLFVDRPLRLFEQIVLLGHCSSLLEISNHRDELEMGKLDAYAQRCLISPDEAWETSTDYPSDVAAALRGIASTASAHLPSAENVNWLVSSSALWFRSRCEFHRVKRKERSLVQMSVLLEQIRDLTPSAAHRLAYVDYLDYPNVYEFKLEHARRLRASGFLLSAKDLYVEMGLVDKAAECLILCERKHEALDLLNKSLDDKPTPQVLVCLGDASSDPSFFARAWELSGQKFAEAQRRLGSYHYRRGNYKDALAAFVEALKLNPQHANVWYCRAISEMRLKLFSDAANSFGKFCYLEEENGEGWANMTAAHIQMGSWSAAYLSACEAIRKSRTNWMVWDNFIRVCIKLRNVGGALEGFNAMLRLNESKRLTQEVGCS